ncbi:hypothetical protein M918_09220 [Clostridium sp. BL8]|nr:hypothetical protein M918_09220 [Clostridium sp. BL8]
MGLTLFILTYTKVTRKSEEISLGVLQIIGNLKQDNRKVNGEL